MKKQDLWICVAYSHSLSPARAAATPFSTRLPHLPPMISAPESPEWCGDYNSQSALLQRQEQGRLGMPCLQRAFPLAKEGRVGGGPSACPKPWLPGAAIQAGSLPLRAAQPWVVRRSRGRVGRREGTGSPDAWVLGVPGDGPAGLWGGAQGEVWLWHHCPTPFYWRAPGAPSCWQH